MSAAAKPPAAHTPGPLALTKIASPIYGSNGSMVAEGVGIGAMNSVYVATVTGRKRDADAERLVACWNACEGMSDPAVEISALRSRSNGVPAMCAEVESLRAEVERLREALRACLLRDDIADAAKLRAALQALVDAIGSEGSSPSVAYTVHHYNRPAQKEPFFRARRAARIALKETLK